MPYPAQRHRSALNRWALAASGVALVAVALLISPASGSDQPAPSSAPVQPQGH